MKVKTEDLSRMCYNAIQFSAVKSTLGGTVLFMPYARDWDNTGQQQDSFSVYASDDYVAMTDSAPAEVGGGEVFALGLKELKEVERYLRDFDSAEDVEVERLENKVRVGNSSYDIAEITTDHGNVRQLTQLKPNGIPDDAWALRPERFAKFRLLKTPESPNCEDGYPVDFAPSDVFLHWKCGPYLRGVIKPVDRDYLYDLYEGEDVLW